MMIKASNLAISCKITLVMLVLLPSVMQTALASTNVYIDWQTENLAAGGHLTINAYPQTIESNQTYEITMTLTLEWIDWGDTVSFGKLNWLFADGNGQNLSLGFSVAGADLNKTAPLTLLSHWSLPSAPSNSTGMLQVNGEVNLKDSKNPGQTNNAKSPASFKLNPSVRIFYKTESKLTLSLSRNVLSSYDTLVANGTIIPLNIQTPIALEYTLPNGTKVQKQVVTDQSGNFTDIYVPDVTGGWSIKASWAGNEYYSGSSIVATFTVNPPFPTFAIALVGFLSGIIIVAGILAFIPGKPRSSKIVPIARTRGLGGKWMRSAMLAAGIVLAFVGWILLIYDSFLPISDLGRALFYTSHFIILVGIVLLVVAYRRLSKTK